MNILYIACGSGCDQTMGGSLSRTIEIAKRLNKEHSVRILTSSGGKQAVVSHIPKERIYELKTPLCHIHDEQKYLLKQLMSYVGMGIQTIPLIFRLPHFDIVYLDSDGLWDVFPALLYKMRHPTSKIVSMNHHKITLRREGRKSLVFSFINIVMQRIAYFCIRYRSDALLVLNTHMGEVITEEFTRMGYTKPIIPVKDGVDTSMIYRVPDQKQRYDACFFGYLRPSKGLYDIVPIWRQVKAKLPDARLIIIGGMLPEYRTHLVEAISKNDLEKHIIIQDYVPEKEKAIAKVKQSHIFISPSREEGWGISIMECLSSGIPGVVWDLPTYEQIFHEGLIKVEKFDMKQFSDAIIDLLTNASRYKTLQMESVASVKKYDWDIVAREEKAIFTRIHNKK